MSDIRFNQWLHQSGTGGVSQSDGGHVGIGTTNPLLPVGAGNTNILHVGVVTSNSISAGSSITATTFYGSGANLTSIPITSGADNRVITASSASAIQGEANLTYDGLDLVLNGTGDKAIRWATGGANKWSIYHNNSAGALVAYDNANSAERLRITSDGDVGMDTSPANYSSYKTFTVGAGSVGSIIELRGTTSNFEHLLQNNNGDLIFEADLNNVKASTNVLFKVDGGQKLRITSDGDFGTNGVTPTTQSGRVFHLHAGAAQQRFHMTNNTTGSAATDGFEILIDQETNANCRIRNFEAGYMAFDTGGSNNEAFRINADGNLLIGTSSYAYSKRLNVQGSTGAILSLANYDTTTYAADTNTSIDMRINTGNTGNQTGSCEIRAFKENGTNGNNARGLSFYTASNGASPAKRMVIDSSGQVTKPYQYVFMVETTGHSKTANWSKITGLAPRANQCTGVSDGTNWSNSTQQFTAPVAGVYHFFVGGWSNPNSNGSRYAYTFKHTNGNNYDFIGGGDYCSADSPMAGWCRTIKLSAGEWVELWGFSAITATWGGGHRFFWGGYLLG